MNFIHSRRRVGIAVEKSYSYGRQSQPVWKAEGERYRVPQTPGLSGGYQGISGQYSAYQAEYARPVSKGYSKPVVSSEPGYYGRRDPQKYTNQNYGRDDSRYQQPEGLQFQSQTQNRFGYKKEVERETTWGKDNGRYSRPDTQVLSLSSGNATSMRDGRYVSDRYRNVNSPWIIQSDSFWRLSSDYLLLKATTRVLELNPDIMEISVAVFGRERFDNRALFVVHQILSNNQVSIQTEDSFMSLIIPFLCMLDSGSEGIQLFLVSSKQKYEILRNVYDTLILEGFQGTKVSFLTSTVSNEMFVSGNVFVIAAADFVSYPETLIPSTIVRVVIDDVCEGFVKPGDLVTLAQYRLFFTSNNAILMALEKMSVLYYRQIIDTNTCVHPIYQLVSCSRYPSRQYQRLWYNNGLSDVQWNNDRMFAIVVDDKPQYSPFK